MDPITVGGLAFAWLAAMAGGSLLTVGVMEVVTARAIINLNKVTWSREEATLLGLTRVVQGLSVGIYGLAGMLFISRVIVFPFAGTPWGFFVSWPFALLFLAAVIAQGLIATRSRRRGRG